MVNKTEVKGNWNEQKGKLQQKFAELTDNDLMFEEAKKGEMFEKTFNDLTIDNSK